MKHSRERLLVRWVEQWVEHLLERWVERFGWQERLLGRFLELLQRTAPGTVWLERLLEGCQERLLGRSI
jgi:hypothetical protein